MRILQLIDSLELGGAERMAVNYANALSSRISFSGLVCSRREGALKSQLLPAVDYLFLNKKRTLDFRAILLLRSYCRRQNISHIQAHGTSFFTAFLLKILLTKTKLIWHDHYGARSEQALKQNKVVWFCSNFFNGIIVVSHPLENWVSKNLNVKQYTYLPNFAVVDEIPPKETFLKGEEGKRILCLANLKQVKNQRLLVNLAEKVRELYPDWTFHLVGKDFGDAYSNGLKQVIHRKSLEGTVFLYGDKTDTSNIIQQSDIAIISSRSEGLPLVLMEYGLYQKPVIASAVGEISALIQNNQNGMLCASGDLCGFFEGLILLIADPQKRQELGKALQLTVNKTYSEATVLVDYLRFIQTL